MRMAGIASIIPCTLSIDQPGLLSASINTENKGFEKSRVWVRPEMVGNG
jgi:hypothetical protein